MEDLEEMLRKQIYVLEHDLAHLRNLVDRMFPLGDNPWPSSKGRMRYKILTPPTPEGKFIIPEKSFIPKRFWEKIACDRVLDYPIE